MKKMSRMESNREVRRALNRHSVDLTYTQYSVAGLDIRLTGWLQKLDGTEFSANQLEALIEDFQRKLPGYSVSGDMDNWNFSSDYVTYVGDRLKSKHELEQEQDQDAIESIINRHHQDDD